MFPNSSSYNNFLSLRSGLTIFPSQDREIDRVLAEMLQNIPAAFILLCDVSGQIVSARGDRRNIDPVALGALIAGDLAANQEIARLLGEYQAYQITLREGTTAHTFIAEAGRYLALLVQVDVDVPLGWARMLILKSARALADIVDTPPPEARLASEPPITEPSESAPPSDEEDLTEMFGDALDDLWNSAP